MAVKNGLTFEQLYQRKKKEKEQEQADAFYEQYQQAVQRQKEINSIRANSHKKLEAQATKNSTVTSSKADDLAPVKTTVSSDGEENTWFKEGEGSIWQKILGSATDIRENLAAGIIGLGEKFVDAAAQFGTLMNQQSQMLFTQDQILRNNLAGNKTGAASVLNKNLAYQKEVEKGTAEFIAKDLYDEEAVAKLLITKPYEAAYGVNVEDSSVFGKKSESLIQSGGQLLGTAALQAAGVPWWMTSGTSAFGSEVESAYNSGATFDEATLSGAISAGAEILTEKLGGISFGGASLTDDAVKLLSKGVTNKVAKALMKVGKLTANGFAEGGEEVLSGYISALGQKLTYMSDAEMSELFSSEEALDSFIGGFVLGEIGEFGNVAKSAVTGEDYVTGLTKSEQAVVAKLVEERAKETDSSKRKVYDDVLKDLKKGYISTDAIESVLGGDTYKAYKDSIDSESRLAEQKESLTEEFNTLNRMKTGEMTGEQTDRLNELRTKISDINKQIEETKQSADSSKIKLSEEVVNRLKSDRGGQGSMLLESYNEQSRRGQAYEADISQYDESQRAVIQKAVDSGILNNTNRTHDFVDMIAKISADKGVLFDFANNAKLKESGFALDGKTVNGYVTKDGITLNIDSKKSLNSVVGHEITHVLEGTDLYTELQTALFDYAKSKNDYQGRYDSITKLYEGIEGTDVDTELTADLIGDYLFTDADFINSLSANHRSVFQKIYDEIKYLCKVATAGSKEAKELEKVKKLFAEAYRTETKNTTQEDGVRYSIVALDNGNVYVDASRNVINGETRSEQRKEISDFFNRLLDGNSSIDVHTIEGDVLTITKAETATKARDDYKTVDGKPVKMSDDEFAVKLRVESHIDEIAEVSTTKGRKADSKNHSFAKDGFTYRRAYFKDFDGQYYEVTLSIGNNGTIATVYNVGKIKESVSPSAKIIAVVGSKPLGATLSTDNISPSAENVNNDFPSNDAKASLSEDLAPVAPVGTYNVYGKDIELAPVREDLQTPKASESKNTPAPVVDWDEITDEVDRQEEIKRAVGNKYDFISNRADELYQEIKNLQKGVKASDSLGYLLDHGYEWKSIKTALLNIRDNPDRVINENSPAETVAREMLNEEYSNLVESLSKDDWLSRSITQEINNLRTELESNIATREQTLADYNAEIASLKSEYDTAKNKDSKEALKILREIEKLERKKKNVAKQIVKLEERIERMLKPEYKRAKQRQAKETERNELWKSLVGDTSTWKDKKLGLSYKINTLRRNLRDIVRDANGKRDIAKADEIYDELQGEYNHNEALKNRETNSIKKPYAEMKITAAEDAYIQMLGEFRHNPDTTLTKETVDAFYNEHKDSIDTAKVDKAIAEARKTYDSLLQRLNEVLREQGMKEIPYRKGYFPHFTEDKQNFFAKLLNWKTQNNDIPTDIAGLTENFKPNRSWQSFNKQRKGDTTDYSFTKGLDTYVNGALDWIYHIEDIQKRRSFENYIRYVHSEKGVQEKINAIYQNEEYDADETQEQIDLVLKEAGNPLNNFVTDLRAGTNALANKKSPMDRSMEEGTNRKIYSTMTNISNRVNANFVAGSVSSALTNFIPITQSWGEVSPLSSLKAMGATIRAYAHDDGIIDKSDFLTNRLEQGENLYQTTWDKIGDKAGFLMECVDNFTSQTVWRSKYLENLSKGMSESEAIKNADIFAEGVMAGRSRGNMPTAFNAKNPVAKVLTVFQLEVNNQYGYMFKDMPQDMRNDTKAKLVKGYIAMFMGAYAYNALYSSLTGRDAAFDPAGIIEDLLRDLGWIGDDEEEPGDIAMNLIDNVLEEVPFIGGLVGGGRIPISSALPYDGIYEAVSGTIEDVENKNWSSLTKEWLNPVYYLALPMAGGQIKKSIEGLSMFSDEHPIAGSYTDSGNLRFPVEDTPLNRIQASLFGQWASENARDYFDNERSPLKEQQIREFIDVDIPIQDYWEYREGLAKQDTLEAKFDYIAGLDLPVEKKNILINNALDRKEEVDLAGYDDFASYEEFDFATKNPEKYDFLQANDISYEKYNATEESREAYNWVINNPEKLTLSKAIKFDVPTYKRCLNVIGKFNSKDENGETVSGLKKERVKNYIFNKLDIDYGAKCILFKSMGYSVDDDMNEEIIDYLNEREDISRKEMETILLELGFTVNADGTVEWD